VTERGRSSRCPVGLSCLCATGAGTAIRSYRAVSGLPQRHTQEVLWMNVDHRLPYVDDNGIRFELRRT